MKINSLNSSGYIAIAFAALFMSGSSIAWAQTPEPSAAPITESEGGKQVQSADSVLAKLKQNASPVTINDMIAAQDVLTRLDLISQIEDKMAKIDEARSKRSLVSLSTAAQSPGSPAEPALTNASAIDALKKAGVSLPNSGSMSGAPQILAISGTDGNYSAIIQEDGHQISVKNGGTIPGLGTVNSIDASSVTVLKPSGKITKLGFTEN